MSARAIAARAPAARPIAAAPGGRTAARPRAGALLGRFGNAGTAALLADRAVVRPKLEVGAASDPLEREADATADKVVRMKAGGDCAACARGDPCEGEAKVRRASDGGGGGAIPLAPAAEASIRRATSGGEALPEPVRASMEPRFGADFSGVRVHRDAAAADSARGIGAHAYTVGNHIAFGTGQWAPGTDRGDHLIAHELTHTLQDGNRARSRAILRRDGPGNGAPTEVPGDAPGLGERLEAEVQNAFAGANQDSDLMLRPLATRRLILLRRPHGAFAHEAELDSFIEEANRLAATELDTLNALGAWRDVLLDSTPKGFPLTWSGRIYAALTFGTDPGAIVAEYQEELRRLNELAAPLPDALFANGLPLTFEESAQLQSYMLRPADQARTGPVAAFAAATVRFAQIRFVASFAMTWEAAALRVRDAVADGSYVPNHADYADFVANRQTILRGLPARARERFAATEEELQALQTDAVALEDVALGGGLLAGFAGLVGVLAAWDEGRAIFNRALAQADARIAGASGGERILRALRWAWANDHFSAALGEAVNHMIASGPEQLGALGVMLVLQRVPGLNIPISVLLMAMGANDALSFVDQLGSALGAVAQAPDVVSLQRASVALTRALAAGGIAAAMAIITAGVARVAGRLRSRAAQLQAAESGLAEEAALRRAAAEMSEADRAVLRPATAARDWETGLNAETSEFLGRNPGVRQRYLGMEPPVREVFTLCASLCIIENVQRREIDRVAGVLRRLGEGVIGRLKIYFHVRRTHVGQAVDELTRVRTVQALDDILERSLIRQANPPTDPLHTRGAATALRNAPGVVTGGVRLPRVSPGEPWLGQSGGRVGLVPGQVAEVLRDRPYSSFDGLQSAFWRAVARFPELTAGFEPADRLRIRGGGAPEGPLRPGGAARGNYVLHHVTPISHGGGVYDLDNLVVVSPSVHSGSIHAPTRGTMPALPPRPVD